MRLIGFSVLLGALATACSGEVDCRHKSRECATGFACVESDGGAWQCLERPNEGPSAIPVAKGPPPCSEHPLCVPEAVDCICDAQGRFYKRTLDKDGDGKADESARYDYGGGARVKRILVDENLDGVDDKRHKYMYDQRGNPVVWEIYSHHETDRKDSKSRLSYLYDNDGKLTSTVLDIGMNGQIDETCEYDPPCPAPIPNPDCKKTCK
jgi:hypothetical protein